MGRTLDTAATDHRVERARWSSRPALGAEPLVRSKILTNEAQSLLNIMSGAVLTSVPWQRAAVRQVPNSLRYHAQVRVSCRQAYRVFVQ